MRIFKYKDRKNYSKVDSRVLCDSNLSWKAKGILTYLLGKPANWRLSLEDIVKQSKDGKDAIYSGIQELVELGYMKKMHLRDTQGRAVGVEYHVYEKPHSVFRDLENPDLENPDLENPDLENPPPITKELNNLRKEQRNSYLYDEEFEEVWSLYPKRSGGNPKKAAHKAWKARVREGILISTLVKATKGYAAAVKHEGNQNTSFVMMASTFFGPNERYVDYVDWVSPNANGSKGAPDGFYEGMPLKELIELRRRDNLKRHGTPDPTE